MSPRLSSAARVRALLASILVLIAAAACSGGASSADETTETQPMTGETDGTASSAPREGGSSDGQEPSADGGAPTSADTEPETDRAMEHIRHLAVEIGARPAGTEAEREAARYIADQLTEAGYETDLEEFTFESERDDSVVTLPDGTPLRALAMGGSPSTEASGTTVHGGLGGPEDLAGADLDGHVVIFDRGIVTFGDKARAAEAAGAIAVVVVNDEPGLFRGSLGDGVTSSIPVVGVASEDAQALEEAIGERITVTAEAGRQTFTSQNVVASLGGECRAYLGGHYDSVTVSPGANDNASGTAVVLEIARVNPVDGLCIVLFGAEELGLFGSQNYVAEHLAGAGRFMLNVDMAGRLDGPAVIGDSQLTQSILATIEATGSSEFSAGQFPPFASSDHVSFESVGVPAVTFNSGNDDAIHTAQDTIERIEEEAVTAFLHAIDTALDALVEEHADTLSR